MEINIKLSQQELQVIIQSLYNMQVPFKDLDFAYELKKKLDKAALNFKEKEK